VGTLPQFASAEEAFSFEQSELSGQLRRWYGGETGARSEWFVPVVKALKTSSKIRTKRHGDWSDYSNTDRLATRRSSRLAPPDIPLTIVRDFEAEFPIIPATADQPLQVGIPGYLDMALFIFGPFGVLRHGRTFRRALGEQIRQVHARAGSRVVFQLEVPAALIAVASTPRPARRYLALALAKVVTAQVKDAPEGSRFGVHLCLGDLGHRALRQLRDTGPLVELGNAIQKVWPEGRRLDFIHLPLSGGEQPPPVDADFYRALESLRQREGMAIVAGIAHEDQPLATQRDVRHLVEGALGCRVDIATSCGLGRRSPAQAKAAVERMRHLRH
jgi:hypothetical protein